MSQKHPFERQQKQGMTVCEYGNIKAPGSYLSDRLNLITVPEIGLRKGFSPVIGHASKETLWTLKLTDRVLDPKNEKDLAEARHLATNAGITEVNF
ncbi:MAG: hypothetical protein AAB501_02250 [Patescibacteria group bacterium]